MRRIITFLLLWLFAWPAFGQSYFTTPNAQPVPGTQLMCQDGSAKAVPCGDGSNPLVIIIAPSALTQITASFTGTTGATVATLPGAASKTTFICGFTITASATTLVNGAATVSGTVSGSLNYRQTALGALNGTSVLQQNFSPCIPASTVNTDIVVTSVAAGIGGNTAVSTWGYQQ